MYVMLFHKVAHKVSLYRIAKNSPVVLKPANEIRFLFVKWSIQVSNTKLLSIGIKYCMRDLIFDAMAYWSGI